MKLKNIKPVLAFFCFFVFYLGMNLAVFAQPGNPDTPENEVPISGIEILILLGGALGIKKVLDFRKFKK